MKRSPQRKTCIWRRTEMKRAPQGKTSISKCIRPVCCVLFWKAGISIPDRERKVNRRTGSSTVGKNTRFGELILELGGFGLSGLCVMSLSSFRWANNTLLCFVVRYFSRHRNCCYVTFWKSRLTTTVCDQCWSCSFSASENVSFASKSVKLSVSAEASVSWQNTYA